MTSSCRAARRSPPASLPLLLPPRPRAPPPGGLRKRRGRRAADKPRPALRCGRRPRPRDTSGRRAPAAAAPRAGAVSQQNANARGRGGSHEARLATAALVRVLAGPGRAQSRRRAAPRGGQRVGGRGRPAAGAWGRAAGPPGRAGGGWGERSPFCAGRGGTGREAPGERDCRAETGASRASPSGRTAG